MENYECLNNNTLENVPLPPPPPPPPRPKELSPLERNKSYKHQQKVNKKNSCKNNNNNNSTKYPSYMKGPTEGGGNKNKKFDEGKTSMEKTTKTKKPNTDKSKVMEGEIVDNAENEIVESPQLSVPGETINEFYQFKGLLDPSAKKENEGSHIKKQIFNDYKQIRATMNFVFDFMANPTKNRFTNVMMFSEGNCFINDTDDPENRYYHANKVTTDNGIYIMAQAPLKNTVKTFWDMIWEQGTCIIASFCDYSIKEDCFPYFELSFNKKVKIGHYVIRTEERKISTPAIIFKLKVYNKKTKQGRIVNIINWMGWNVDSIPSISNLLAMMSLVWKMEHIVEVDDKRSVGPILVHGVSGSRRTATFVAINILCKQLRDSKKCSVITTSVLIRKFRHNAIRDHIMFAVILLAIMHFSASLKYVSKSDSQFVKASKAIISFVSTSRAAQKNLIRKEKHDEEVDKT
uniref:Tyrosine phosphatase n=1 Tax=Strongyloides stercoralis TaxID=6248 RepID=A0A0K0EF64_STRER